MDTRLSNNIKELQRIADFINQTYFNDEIKMTVLLGNVYTEPKPRIEIQNYKMCSFILVDFTPSREKMDYVECIFRQIVENYMIFSVPDWEQKINKRHISRMFPCSNSRRYHNEAYKEKVESLGCITSYDKTYGWKIKELPKKLKEFLETIHFSEFNFYIPIKDIESKIIKRRTNSIRYYCPVCGSSGFFTSEQNNLLHDPCRVPWEIDYTKGRYSVKKGRKNFNY